MRLINIREFLDQAGIVHQYSEEGGCGSIDFMHRGLSYHIWEFPAEEQGAESNVRTTGKMETFGSDYEAEILAILKSW